MANRRKRMTISEQIEAINEEINAKELELNSLKAKKKELEKQKKTEEIEELYNLIAKSGKTVDEVKAMNFGSLIFHLKTHRIQIKPFLP